MTRNGRTAAMFAGLPAAMLALGFASVPLYRVFCQATGFNGTTQRLSAAQAAADEKPVGSFVNVRFDANVNPKLPWRFAPEQRVQHVAVGARQMAFFTATNLSDRRITGSATFNVTPEQSGQYFTKIQCFCFTQQTLEPGETVRMPVVYFVQPDFATNPDTRDISEITLSYTFYPVDSPETAG